MGFLLWKADLMDSIIIEKYSMAPWAILSLWVLILYLSVILWLPFHNIWECIERVKYSVVKEKDFRQKIGGSLNLVLVAFSMAFIVLSVSIIFITEERFSQKEENVIRLVIGLLTVGVIFLIVTLEAYDACLNPAFASAQIARIYTKGCGYIP